MNHLTTLFFGLNNRTEFIKGIQHAVNHLQYRDGIYTGDNLFTYGRNLSFLGDSAFMAAFGKHAQGKVEQGILWRIAVVAWGAFHGTRLAGG